MLVNKRQRRLLQQQHDWIPLDFRPLFIPHRVSRIPHLRVRQALRSVICSGYCSVISRFRFSLSFLPLPLSLLKGMHCAFTILERSQGIGDTMDNRYTYPIKDHCRVESLRRRMANGISLITNLELQLSTLSRSPVFSNLSYFFQGSSFAFITKFYNLINFWSIRSSFVLPYRIYRYIYIYILNFLKAIRIENVILLTIFIMGFMVKKFDGKSVWNISV